MKYFNQNDTIENIRREYFRLAKLWHPDLGGEKYRMQEINLEYEQVLKLKSARGSHTFRDGKNFKYEFNSEIERKIREKLAELLALRLLDLEIMLAGTWIWVLGNTKPHKDTLKNLGFWWSGDKEAWYFHAGKKFFRGAKRLSLNEIARNHGAQNIKHQHSYIES